MARLPDDMATEIDRRLTATVEAAGCPARQTAAGVRDDAIEWLTEEIDEDNERFPEYADAPKSNLWAMDDDKANTLFWVLIIFPGHVEFFCGTGNFYEIIDFHDPADLADLYEAMRGSFHIPESLLRIDRARAEEWLGRSW
jgi:hypothetical protein